MKAIKRIIIVGLMIMISSGSAMAAEEAVNKPNCGISLRPFNPTGTELFGAAADAQSLYLTKSGQISASECRSRVPFYEPHNQQSVIDDYQSFNVNMDYRIEKPIHIHTYVNNNVQDDKWYYRSHLYKYQIVLEDDALENTLLNTTSNRTNLTCSLPVPNNSTADTSMLADCDGYAPNVYGGTMVKNYTNPDTGEVMVEWLFGVDADGFRTNDRIGKVPMRYGNNPDLNDDLEQYFRDKNLSPSEINLQTQDDPYRFFSPRVAITSSNNSSKAEYWSATTSSRALVKNYAVEKETYEKWVKGKEAKQRINFFEKVCEDYDTDLLTDTNGDGVKENVETNWTLNEVTNEWAPCSGEPLWSAVPASSNLLSSQSVLPDVLKGEELLYFYYRGTPGADAFIGEFGTPGTSDMQSQLGKAYWVPIGSEVTIWKGLPTEQSICTDLTIEPSRIAGPNESATFTVTPEFSGAEIPLRYYWTNAKEDPTQTIIDNLSRRTQGYDGGLIPEFEDQVADLNLTLDPSDINGFKNAENFSGDEKNPYRATDEETYFRGGQAGNIISVVGIDENGAAHPECTAALVIPQDDSPICQEVIPSVFEISFDGEEPPLATSWTAMEAGNEYEIGINQSESILTDGSQIENFQIKVEGNKTPILEKADPNSTCPEVIFIDPVEQNTNTTATTGTGINAMGKTSVLISQVPPPRRTQDPSQAASEAAAAGAAAAAEAKAAWEAEQAAKAQAAGEAASEASAAAARSATAGSSTPDTTAARATYNASQAASEGAAAAAEAARAAGQAAGEASSAASAAAARSATAGSSTPDVAAAQALEEARRQGQAAGEASSAASAAAARSATAGSSTPDTRYARAAAEADPLKYTATLINQAPANCKYLYTPNSGDKLTITAVPDNDVKACVVEKDFPIEGPICQELDYTIREVNATDDVIDNDVDITEIEANKIYIIGTNPATSVKTDGSQIDQYVINLNSTNQNPAGSLEAIDSAINCPLTMGSPDGLNRTSNPADLRCEFRYQSTANDKIIIKAVEDNDVTACQHTFEIGAPPPSEICEDVNLYIDNSPSSRIIPVPGNTHRLTVDPITNLGNALNFVDWTIVGDGYLLSINDIGGTCPALIKAGDDGVAPSDCEYFYHVPEEGEGSISVRAIPDDSVAACIVEGDFFEEPIDEDPYCLYLDLDYAPEPYRGNRDTRLITTVVLSDGSRYEDDIEFEANDNSAEFDGGEGKTSGRNPFYTEVDNRNQTIVDYEPGDIDTDIRISLANTSIDASTACYRRLNSRGNPPPPPPVCEEEPEIEDSGNDRYCVTNLDDNVLLWRVTGATFDNGFRSADAERCVNVDDDDNTYTVTVEDTRYDNCDDLIRVDNPPTPPTGPPPPTIEKRVSKGNSGTYGRSASFSTTGGIKEKLTYQITYEPRDFVGTVDGNTTFMTVRIDDPVFATNGLRGEKLRDINATGSARGELGGTIKTTSQSSVIGYSKCSTNDRNRACYEIKDGYILISGINSDDPITINYQAELDSSLTEQDCQFGEFCSERFENQAVITEAEYCYEVIDPTDGSKSWTCQDSPYDNTESNIVLAEVVCSYFLTRASGDVFLEDDLQYGVDVSRCYPFRNVTSTIVTPREIRDGNLAATGTDADNIVTITNQLCAAGQASFEGTDIESNTDIELRELFGANVSENLSSQICEIGAIPGTDWNSDIIQALIKNNIEKLTRWRGTNNNNIIINNWNALDDVFYYNGDLNPNAVIIINGLNIPENGGAKTIIIENANLEIRDDIRYTGGDLPLNQSEIASLGIIVINGNMYIDKNVEELAGAYFVSRDPENTKLLTTGNILSGDTANPGIKSEKTLTIYGSVFGNIGPLFKNRQAAGDIRQDEGSITIRYDQRIIQNTPPGLGDLFGNFEQSQIAR